MTITLKKTGRSPISSYCNPIFLCFRNLQWEGPREDCQGKLYPGGVGGKHYVLLETSLLIHFLIELTDLFDGAVCVYSSKLWFIVVIFFL